VPQFDGVHSSRDRKKITALQKNQVIIQRKSAVHNLSAIAGSPIEAMKETEYLEEI